MKKVLITGATGFIGNKLVDKLLNEGYSVITVVRENSERIDILKNRNVEIVYCNLDKIKNLPSLLEGKEVDTIYHFAWQGVSNEELKNEYVQLNNVKATLDLINIAPLIGCNRFIGAGSIHELEAQSEMNEDKIVTNLGMAYKTAKLTAHYMGKALAGSKGLEFFWPIISNTYGVGEKSGRLINTIIRNIFNNQTTSLSAGNQNYDFVYIDDLINAFYLIGAQGINGHNYFIGSGNAKPLKKYLQIVGEIANRKNNSDISLSFGDIKSNVVDLPIDMFNIDNLVKDTGWRPTISFAKGIQLTVDWIWNNTH